MKESLIEMWKRKLALCIFNLEEDESSDDEIEMLQLLNCCNDNEEEIVQSLLPAKRAKRNCIRNYVEEVVPRYTENEFRTHFRINSELFTNLAKRLEEHHLFNDLRSDKRLPASKYILIFLWYAGHEACSFRDIADRFDVCIATVNRIITRVTMFLCDMSDEVITWPNSEKMEKTARYFKEKYGFPNVIGAIDGSHIIIDPPKEGKDDYINRKKQTSICLQAICDENQKFADIFVGYPGPTHDSRVFQNSFIFPKLDALCKDEYILGDTAYPLMKNVLVPYKDNGHLSLAQKYYNRRLSSCRVIIEHSFGILKQRFRQLYYCKLKGMEKLCHFVKACCVLHNVAKETDLPFTEEIEGDVEDTSMEEGESSNTDNLIAKCIRNSIFAQIWESKET